jgi:hypothetical protein
LYFVECPVLEHHSVLRSKQAIDQRKNKIYNTHVTLGNSLNF